MSENTVDKSRQKPGLPLISVVITGYNHEQYIARSIESVLMQKGAFRLQVILGDDCSTDGTRRIMQSYHEKHPDIFVLLPEEPNMGIPKNLRRCFKACTGEYIAFCESDDYWTDSYKLQKQLEFMQSHPDYSLCFGAIMLYYEDENKYVPFSDPLFLKTDTLTTEDLIKNNYIGTVTCCMYRSDVIKGLPAGIYEIPLYDWIFNMTCSQMGPIGFIRDWMAVYRKHAGGAWSGRSYAQQCLDLLKLLDGYNEFFNFKYDKQFRWKKEQLLSEYRRSSAEENSQQSKPSAAGVKQPSSNSLKKFWALSMWAARNPRAAFNLVFLNTLMVLNKYQGSGSPASRYFGLFARAVRHPGAAFSAFGTVASNISREANNLYIASSINDSLKQPKLKDKKVDLLILDNVFPHPYSPFRLQEFCSYLSHFKSSVVLTTGESLVCFNETKTLQGLIDEFELDNPELAGKTRTTSLNVDNFTGRLAYLTFLYNVDMFLPALEKKQIPFIFTLYPGGAFEINQEKTDSALRRIFGSPLFKKVIVTQQMTYDYLLENHFCAQDKIKFIFGVVTPLEALARCNDYHRTYFHFDKDSLDICFVAHKYMPGGIDKGYDVFIGVAKKLAALHPNINFHVVGDFNKADIPIDGLEGKITFYGLRPLEWFDKFYVDKDIILSPNIPFVLLKGSFDGFPTAACTEAGLRKVAMFCADELKLNKYFMDGDEIVIIPHNVDRIVSLIEGYYADPEKLRSIGRKGAQKIREVYSYENQILPRIKIIEKQLREG